VAVALYPVTAISTDKLEKQDGTLLNEPGLSTKAVDNHVIKSSYCTLTFCLFWSLVKLTKNYTDIFQQKIRLHTMLFILMMLLV
jgi:hypothetical protein